MNKEMRKQMREIASRIVELREISDLSAEEMAANLKLPVETYLAYENAEVDFPVSVLYEIASQLKVDLTELLTGISPKLVNCSLVRSGEGIAVDRYQGYDFENIAYKFIGRKIEPMIVRVGADTEFAPPEMVQHPGQEFNYVLEGDIKVHFGKREFLLHPGDCFYFDSSVSHAQSAVGGKAAKFLTVILL